VQSEIAPDEDLAKVKFLNEMVQKGAKYFADGDLDRSRYQEADFYCFSFNKNSILDRSTWELNKTLLLELL
jgi:hypothetical protein